MQNPRVSLPSVGAREVRHGNTRLTTRTARFFPYTNYGKLNWPRTAARNGGCDRCSRWSPTANQWFLWLYSNTRHAINKRRTSPGSWSQELSSHAKINEIRQWRPKWRQFKKVVSLAGLHQTSLTFSFDLVLCLFSSVHIFYRFPIFDHQRSCFSRAKEFCQYFSPHTRKFLPTHTPTTERKQHKLPNGDCTVWYTQNASSKLLYFHDSFMCPHYQIRNSSKHRLDVSEKQPKTTNHFSVTTWMSFYLH